MTQKALQLIPYHMEKLSAFFGVQIKSKYVPSNLLSLIFR